MRPSSSQGARARSEIRSTDRLTVQEGSRRDGGLPSKFKLGRQLGKGGFAEVFAARDTEANDNYAVKVVAKNQITRHRALAKLRSEIEIHRSLNHERIVKFHDHFEDRDSVYMLLSLCPNQTLSEFVKKRQLRRMTEPEAIFYLYDLVVALKYLHSSKIIHRDLKLGNLFLDEYARLKVGDFGLAARLERDSERRKTKCGTPNYIAPEILDDAGHSYEVDIWSLGVVAYTLLCGRPPFESSDVKQIYRRIQANNYTFPDSVNLTSAAKDMVERILQTNPRKRPSLDAILALPWFTAVRLPPAPPASITNSIGTSPRAGSSARAETPEGCRAANYGRIDSPMHRLGQDGSTCSTGASPMNSQGLRPWQSPSLSLRNPATPGRATGSMVTVGRPPLAQRVGDENAPPNANVMTESKDKIIKEPMATTPTGSFSGLRTARMNSWTGLGRQSARASAPHLSGRTASPRLVGKPVTPRRMDSISRTPQNSVTPVSSRSRVPSESPARVSSQPYLSESARSNLGGVTAFAGLCRSAGRDCSDKMPEMWISRWVDYTSRYGVVYQLPDGSVGVYFNDSTKAICLPDGSRFDYIPRSTAEKSATRTSHTFEDYPPELQKKVTLLKHFRQAIGTEHLGNREGATAGESGLPSDKWTPSPGSSEVYVRKWVKRSSASMFSLSNKDIHVVFFDTTEVVVSFKGGVVAYRDKTGFLQSLSLSEATEHSTGDLARRMKYIFSNLLQLRSEDLPAALQAQA